MMQTDRRLTLETTHLFFDRRNPPVGTICPGETITIETERADGMVLTPESPVFRDRQDVLDQGTNPVTGPIFVEGAEPGDRLAVTVLEVVACPDGTPAYVTYMPGPSALMPPYSLGGDFPSRTIWCPIEDGELRFPLKHRELRLPLDPFIGTIGVAPADERRASYWNGQDFVGNLDCPSLRAGATAVLPVNVPGALLSLGDVHARQGHGEIAGCAVECRGEVTVRVELLKPAEAEFGEWPQVNTAGFLGSVGCVAGSMELSARAALHDLVLRLERFHGFDRLDAYWLLGQCVELEVCQLLCPHQTCLAKIGRRYCAAAE
jgi:amidase